MTAAMVPQDLKPILQHTYDSRSGFSGAVRIFREGYALLRKEAHIGSNDGFKTKYHGHDDNTCVKAVDIIIPEVGKTFRCVASIQPSPQTEMYIYEVEHKLAPDAT